MAKSRSKKPLKKASPRAEVLRTEQVPVHDLKVFRSNPRVGDIDLIAKSLEANGQFRAIVVNVGTHTGRKNEVLAGNHSFLAARKLGWETILATFVDVDDPRAKAIVLADNKTSDGGSFDEGLLAELLADVPDFESTGFMAEEAEDILHDAGLAAEQILKGLTDASELDLDVDPKEDVFGSGEVDKGDNPFDPDKDDPDDFLAEEGHESATTEEITNRPSQVAGIHDLAPDLPEIPEFRQGYWQMPAIREDMFMTPAEWPEGIVTWAGTASRDLSAENEDQWFHYPWGGDSTKGLQHPENVVLSFYSWDEAFNNWFWTPDKYVAKALNSGIKYAITPDYSMWAGQSRLLNLWAQYRNLYVTRYMQEAGIKVVPHIGMPMGDLNFVRKYLFDYWPTSAPIIANELQNFDRKTVARHEAEIIKQMMAMFEHFQPEMFVLYAGHTGRKWFKEKIEPRLDGIRIEHLEARADIQEQWRMKNGNRRRRKTI